MADSTDYTDALEAHWRPSKPRTYYRVKDGRSVVTEGFGTRYVTFRRDPDGELMRMARGAFLTAYAEDPPSVGNGLADIPGSWDGPAIAVREIG